jgi:hypothetical protein
MSAGHFADRGKVGNGQWLPALPNGKTGRPCLTTARQMVVKTQKYAVFLENLAQDAISLFGALWGVPPGNARLARFFPLRAISFIGALCQSHCR